MKDKIIRKILFLSNGAMLGLILGLLFHPLPPNGEGGRTTVGENSVTAASYEPSLSSFTAPARKVEEPGEEEKICYLTFDDGPSSNTIKILDTLKKYDARATFFVIGNSLTEENRPIVERIVKEGHVIGLHANNHVYEEFYKDEFSWLVDYIELDKRLKEEYGIEASLFRFPGGSACSYLRGRGRECVEIMQQRGFACFDWNVSGEDSVGKPSAETICNNVFKGAFQYNTPVVLLHDSVISDVTAEALPLIMERLAAEGYRFQSLENRKEYVFKSSR